MSTAKTTRQGYTIMVPSADYNAMQAEIDELRAENTKLREALETCATTLNQAGFRKQAAIAYAALEEK